VARQPDTLAGFERGCEAGIGDACAGAAISRALREGVMPDPAAFEQSCALGSAWSCALHFAFELDEASGTETYLEVFRRGMARCHRQGDVCVVLAEPPLIPRGDDVPNPLQFLRTGCAHGDSLSCFDLGRMPADAARLMDPAGLESLGSDDDLPSHEATRGHLTVACDDDIGPACHLLALQLFRGEGGEANPREARARSRAACELGMREACDLLAQTGDGRTFPPPPGAEAYPDAATFEAAHRRYCELGGHGACVQLARARLQAGTTGPDLAPIDEGLGLLVRTCEQRGEAACQLLLKVVGSATAACQPQRDAQACLIAGAVWRRGLEVPASIGEPIEADPVRAGDAFHIACQGGRQAACSELNSAAGDDTPFH